MSFHVKRVFASYLMCRGTGTIGFAEFVDLFDELQATFRQLDNHCLALDVRGCKSVLDFDDELRIVDDISNRGEMFTGSKWAAVVDSDHWLDLAQTGGILVSVSKLPFEYESFRSLDEATQWLGIGDHGSTAHETFGPTTPRHCDDSAVC